MRKRISFFGWLAMAQLLTVTTVQAQGAYKVETAPLPATAEMPAALAAVLEPQGNRVLDPSGATVCEVWLGKALPLQTPAGSSADVLYAGLQFGEFVGAIHFPKAGLDFRGQAIKPGYYTLRYALVPQDGNHMGVNPTRDFVLMSPAAQDTQLDKALKLDELLKSSKQASGTNHPAILTLSAVAPGAATKSATVVQDDQQHWVLQGQAQGKTTAGQVQPLPIAIVVVGQALAAQ